MPSYTLKIHWRRRVPKPGDGLNAGVMTETVNAPDRRRAVLQAGRQFRAAYDDVLEAIAIRDQADDAGRLL